MAEGEVRPRVFFEDFPSTVLYVREVPVQGGGWQDVLAAVREASHANEPARRLLAEWEALAAD